MRAGGALAIIVVASSLTGCGDQGPATGDRSGIGGLVRLGPQCPVQRAGDTCQDKPATRVGVTVAERRSAHPDDSSQVVAHTTTDDRGRYRVAVRPGAYLVTADAGRSCALMHVRVSSGVYSRVDISCDTGIR